MNAEVSIRNLVNHSSCIIWSPHVKLWRFIANWISGYWLSWIQKTNNITRGQFIMPCNGDNNRWFKNPCYFSKKKLKTWIFFWNISQAILTKAKKIKRLAGYNNNLPFVRVRKNILCRDRWQLVPNKHEVCYYRQVFGDKYFASEIRDRQTSRRLISCRIINNFKDFCDIKHVNS